VLAADTGNPVRRATVNLSMTPVQMTSGSPAGTPTGGRGAVPPPNVAISQTVMLNGQTVTTSMGIRPKTATTDSQGAFEFRDLPAGSYRLSANPGQYSAAYLSIQYGAKKPSGPMSSEPGTPIQLAEGQSFDKATMVLPRGSVISGRVTDEDGSPLARVQVYTMFFPSGSTRGMRTGGGGSTDDLGQFRLFGLSPGEYVVVAEARAQTFMPPNQQIQETEEDKIGFMTTYYPGTPDEAAAGRVTARSGAETPGIEIHVVSGRLFRVSGMVVDSQGRSVSRTSGNLQKRGGMGTSSFGFSLDDQGRFQLRNVPPGNYRLTVRGQPIPRPNGMNEGPPEIGEFANMPLSINSDMENLLITMTPGAAITGTVMFESGPPQAVSAQGATPVMRISASSADPDGMTMPSPPPAVVTPDYTFTLKGLSGEMLLRGNAPQQTLKSVLLGAQDITDTPREFKSGDKVTVVFTSHVSTIEGTVTDSKGAPITDARVMIFSDDKNTWRNSSTRVRNGAPDQTGHYRIPNVLPGRYYVIAAPRERFNNPFPDASFFETLSKEATTFVVGEDEQRTVDLKLVGGGG